jgi:hypothetical protein
VTAFRFVDDLFLGARRVIDSMMRAFTCDKIGEMGAVGRHRSNQHPAPSER